MLLIRHGENEFVKSGRLAGWTPNVHLNEFGRQQAESLGLRLSRAKLKALYSSPLERALETAEAISKLQQELRIQIDERLGEVRYGTWTGKRIKQLARTRLWQVVQQRPSIMEFPEGESLREVQLRAVNAVEQISKLWPRGLIAVVSHGDVIKAVIAHYGGIHLDNFQRLMVDTASLSIISLSDKGAAITRLNDVCHLDSLRKS